MSRSAEAQPARCGWRAELPHASTPTRIITALLAKPKKEHRIADMAGTILKHSKSVARRKLIAGANVKPGLVKPKKPSTARPATAKRVATEPSADEIAEREAVARAFFNPASARAAQAAFLKR